MCFAFLFWVYFQGGDKLTLALGSSTNSSTSPPDTTTSGSSSSDKLINLDSPTNKVTPPVPPPRTTSDPNYPNYQNHQIISPPTANGDNTTSSSNDNSENTSIPVSVTHLTLGLNGHGLERETIFTDHQSGSGSNNNNNTTTDAAANVRALLGQSSTNQNNTSLSTTNPFNSSKNNPFLDQSNEESNKTTTATMDLDNLVEQKIQDLINANPFTGKYNTIGRSNPFSNPNTNNSSSKNPFLNSGMSRNNPTNNNNDKIAATSSGEDVNDSPESSLEPEEVEQTINKIVSKLSFV